MKEIIWANPPAFKEESKSNKAFEGIRINKEVQKSINMIMAIDGNNSHDLASKIIHMDQKIKGNPCSKLALQFVHNQRPILESF